MNRLHRWLIPLLILVLAAAALAWQLAAGPTHEERDVVQERLDEAGAPLTPGQTIGQTFFSSHAGLKAVELLLVRYNPDQAPDPATQLTLTLERIDEPREPVRVSINAAGLEHNQHLRLSFPPLRDSEGATYRLTLSSDRNTDMSFWHASADAYAWGERLINGASAPGDLWLITHYDYRLGDALVDLGRLARRYAPTLPALVLLLVLPGWVLRRTLWPRSLELDLGTRLALIVALSLSTWGLLLLWTSVLNISLAGGWVWLVVALWLAAAIYTLWTGRHAPGEHPHPNPLPPEEGTETADDAPTQPATSNPQPATRQDRLPELALACVLTLTLATRLLHIRELVVPAWVDSVHHTVITQAITEQGRIPVSFEPYLPLHDFHYHYGFHANAAVLSWLSGLAPYQSVLLLGQALNTLAALAAYALGTWLSGRRWAGVGAALVTGVLAFMPAYYVSWGRYTQLAGLLLLPLVCVVTARLLAPGPKPRGLWVLGFLLLGGLIVIHYRVLIFYALFCLVYPPFVLWRERGRSAAWRQVLRSGLFLAAGTLVFTLPWVARFIARILPQVNTLYGGWAAPEGVDNSFPIGLLNVGWMRPLLYIAGAGALWGLIRRRGEVILLTLWVGLWFLVANPHLLGLPDIWLMQNSTIVIALWLPVSALGGWLLGDLAHLLGQGLHRLSARIDGPAIMSPLLLAGTLALGGLGAWNLVDVINPITVITTPDDVRAIRWAAENTPPGARFLVNTRRWMGEMRVGSDGGWWLPLLAHRRVTMPCVLYYQVSPEYREEVDDLARTVEESKSLDDPAVIARLRQEGITHVFVGTRGGRLMPKELDASPNFRLRYASGPVRIYEFAPQTAASP